MRRSIATKLSAIVTGVFVLVTRVVAEADFVIRLRDGKEIVVDRYEDEGDQLQYSRFGGKIKVPKSQVAVIEDRKSGEKQVFNPLYSRQELDARGKEEEARLRRRQQDQEILALLRSGRSGVDVRAKFGQQWDGVLDRFEYRVVGEVRNELEKEWRGASLLVRVYRKPHNEFVGQFRIPVTPNVIPAGGSGTFDAPVPSELGEVWNNAQVVYTPLESAK